ncbi:MAG: dihydropteroate synthase [Elusimicrobia bacterium GWA2_61_42]|nr:MAG: dihydropteroate synthase [Elusimicrobia bacterium GWA2_61_42]OGR75114.1 MAG: dihydropteroate synthase [Elusimicrobia bacterium GWC2_61_25]
MKKLRFQPGRTLVCGILNVTPDSFSDGGKWPSAQAAVARALELEAQGADLLDIGGESSRPGSASVALEEEKRRVIPVLEALAGRLKIPISVDTCKPELALLAVKAGADIINDITGFISPAMIEAAAASGAGAIVMHMQGEPRTMQAAPVYRDVVAEVKAFLAERAAALAKAGVKDIILDPGIGFGKNIAHNLELVARLAEIRSIGCPVMLGVSRKKFIGALAGGETGERLSGTIAACVAGAANGADIIRVHDVLECRKAMLVADAIRSAGKKWPFDGHSP